MNTTHHTHSCVHDTVSSVGANNFGMNDRIKRLRRQTFEAQPSLSIERALIETRFYRENYGKYPIPILRALNFLEICKQKTIYIGEDELIVGERGPRPKAVPTFPELTCHSVEDLHILNTRELQRYTISQEDIDTYEREVIPYWKGRTQRERIFSHVPKEWKEAYEVGMFTEFMEQRAPAYRFGRQGLPIWPAGLEETYRGGTKRFGFHERPRGHGQAGGADGHVHLLRRRYPACRATCGLGRRDVSHRKRSSSCR